MYRTTVSVLLYDWFYVSFLSLVYIFEFNPSMQRLDFLLGRFCVVWISDREFRSGEYQFVHLKQTNVLSDCS